jgi:hypothetical protein
MGRRADRIFSETIQFHTQGKKNDIFYPLSLLIIIQQNPEIKKGTPAFPLMSLLKYNFM